MTITNTTTKVGYTGDGVTVAFPVPFPFFDTDELEVVERVISTGAETTKALTTHYTVMGGNGSTGTVTALAAPTASVQWFILRKTSIVQETDYPQNDPFPAESHERALDRGIAISQELREILDRAFKIPKTDPSTAGTELPATVARANKYLGFGPLPNATPIALDAPTVDTSALYVVSSTDPGHQNGRLWLDTSGVSEHLLTVSDGAAWSTIGSRDLATEIWTPYVNGAPAGALAAAGIGEGLEINGGNARVKLDGTTLIRSGAGLKANVIAAINRYYKLKIGNNGASPNSKVDITITRVIAEDGGGNTVLGSNISHTLDITTTGANGRDAGSETSSTHYAIWEIYNPTTATWAGLFSTSYSSPTMPSGYTHKLLIGSVYNDGSSNFVEFLQLDNQVSIIPQLIFSGIAGVTVWTEQSIAGAVPPIAIKAWGIGGLAGANAQSMAVASNANGLGKCPIAGNYASTGIDSWRFTNGWRIFLSTAQKLWWKAASADTVYLLEVTGYEIQG